MVQTQEGAVTVPASVAAGTSSIQAAINVKAYGAKGDGVTDDYSAINKAIAAVQTAGGVLYFPTGTYVASQIPTITGSNILVVGDGPASVLQCAPSSLDATGATIGLWLNAASHVVVRDLVFDGNFTAGAFNTQYSGGFAIPSTVTGVTYTSGASSSPAKGTQETWTVGGISAGSQVSAGYFNGCVFQIGTASSGFELCKLASGVGTSSWTVVRGYGLTATVAAPGGGTALAGQHNQMWDTTVTTYGVKTVKNYVFSLGIAGSTDANTYLTGGVPLRITNGTDITVENCIIRNSRTAGVMVDGPWTSGVGLNQVGSPSTDVRIIGCRIYNTLDNGIFFYKIATGCQAIGNQISDTQYSGIAAVTSTRVQVVGNQIRNAGPSLSDSTGIELAGTVRSVVADNILENCVFAGILFLCSQEGSEPFVPCSNSHITNNVVTGSQDPRGFANGFASNGIEVSGGDSCSIVNNRVSSCDQGIYIDTQARDTVVKGNTLEFNLGLGLGTSNTDNVQGTVFDSNVVRGCAGAGSHACVENAPAVWKNNLILDAGGTPGYAPNSGSNGLAINAAPSGRGRKESWVIDNVFADGRNNGIEIASGFQSPGVAHIHGNEFYNSESQQYFDGTFTVSGGGSTVTLSSTSCAFTSGDNGLKVAIDAWTGPITATISSVSVGVATLGSLSVAQTTNTTLTNVGFSLMASRSYMNRGLYVDSSSSGTFELVDNRIRSLNYATPNNTVPAGSVIANNYESNLQNGASAGQATSSSIPVAVSSNAGTVSAGNPMSTFTNSSAATMTVTMATSGAYDGMTQTVRIYDFSGVSQTITWVNTENGGASVPTTSNGSTTLPKTVSFAFNAGTSKWRCIQSV